MTRLNLADDGDWLTPKETAERLAQLTASGDVAPDYYGVGGPVTELEHAVAAMFGKEAAVMYPTGTLANMLAARELAAAKRGPRLVVQSDSHVFNDAGDNFTHGIGVTTVPLASEGPSFTAEQLRAEIERTASARVPATIVGVMVETPSRRYANRLFDPVALAEIIALAKAENIPLILDGARIFIEAAWTDRELTEITAPFDYIYLSLYKYLDAPFGAVLAGSAAALEGQHHERRRFGGGLFQMWPSALLAHNALARQTKNWAAVRVAGAAVLDALPGLGVEAHRLVDDTNVIRIKSAVESDEVAKRAQARNAKMPPRSRGGYVLKMNESWLNTPPDRIAATIADILRD